MLDARIQEILEEEGVHYRLNYRTIYTVCPSCNRDDKFSILRENGACICYRASCDFGKGFFDKWIVKQTGCSFEQAKKRLNPDLGLADAVKQLRYVDPVPQIVIKKDNDIPTYTWPNPLLDPIDSGNDGEMYLLQRGISKEIAERYGIMYSNEDRRVIFPIMLNGVCRGWQGRAVDKDNPLRVKNNDGFRRDKLVMFVDQVKKNHPVIICEGPIDALKFDLVGGSVATMGKMITNSQIELILSKQPSAVYLALDDDAAEEMKAMVERTELPTYKIDVPKEARERCKILKKKADFGECSLEECKTAFENARKLHVGSLLFNWEVW